MFLAVLAASYVMLQMEQWQGLTLYHMAIALLSNNYLKSYRLN